MITEFWCAVNKGGSLMLFTDEPTRNSKLGIWEGNVYINSWVYDNLFNMLVNSQFNWGSEPQLVQIKKQEYQCKAPASYGDDNDTGFTDKEKEDLKEIVKDINNNNDDKK